MRRGRCTTDAHDYRVTAQSTPRANDSGNSEVKREYAKHLSSEDSSHRKLDGERQYDAGSLNRYRRSAACKGLHE